MVRSQPSVEIVQIETIIVQKYTDQKEEDTVPETWDRQEVKLEYPPKIDVSEKKLSKELEKSFQTLNRLYLTEVNQAKLATREKNQLSVWRTRTIWNFQQQAS